MRSVIYDFEIYVEEQPSKSKHLFCKPRGRCVPFLPTELHFEDVENLEIVGYSLYAGTYGMGGPGFFGLRFEDSQWLIVSIWGAGDWMHIDQRFLTDLFHQQNQRPQPWVSAGCDEFLPLVLGQTIQSLQIEEKSMRLTLANSVVISIDECVDGRPILEGSKEPRMFEPDDDLRKAVFLSPTDQLLI